MCIIFESLEIVYNNDIVYSCTLFHIRTLAKARGRIWDTREWVDKAGGYAIQGHVGARFVKSIRGDYYNVVGLPISRVYQELKKLGAI